MGEQTLLDSVLWHFRSWDEIKRTSLFTLSNYANVFLLIFFVGLAIYQAKGKIDAAKRHAATLSLPALAFPDIERVEDFDWKTAEPEQFRPFKPKYYLTMDSDASALEALDPKDLILMDKNYADRLKYRRRILKEHHDIVVAVNEDSRIGPAVRELYVWLLGTYLPRRYPNIFKLHKANYEDGEYFMLENQVTGEIIPVKPVKEKDKMSTLSRLEILGKHLDEDFLFLLPESDVKEDSKYVLEGYITICPSGFNPRDKLGKRLADIHGPVPAYPERLETSMDKFFSKIEVGKYFRRVNWSITTGAELYAAGDSTTHAHVGDEIAELKEIDIDQTYQRSERQTLHRLPHSNALVFAFKTYLYPLKSVKEEGLGEELADAIDGLKKGNAPQMHFYKRGSVWGEAVKRYLRS